MMKRRLIITIANMTVAGLIAVALLAVEYKWSHHGISSVSRDHIWNVLGVFFLICIGVQATMDYGGAEKISAQPKKPRGFQVIPTEDKK